jgi:hypothetical protein
MSQITLKPYVRQASKLVETNQTPIDLATENGSITLHRKNILDINKQVTVCIKNGQVDEKGNPYQEWIACSVPLSAEIRKRIKNGATIQQMVDVVAGLKIFLKENGYYVIGNPSEAQMIGKEVKDINLVEMERSEEFSPEDLVHL